LHIPWLRAPFGVSMTQWCRHTGECPSGSMARSRCISRVPTFTAGWPLASENSTRRAGCHCRSAPPKRPVKRCLDCLAPPNPLRSR
jgi:hypothetical protein